MILALVYLLDLFSVFLESRRRITYPFLTVFVPHSSTEFLKDLGTAEADLQEVRRL